MVCAASPRPTRAAHQQPCKLALLGEPRSALASHGGRPLRPSLAGAPQRDQLPELEFRGRQRHGN
eukprot:12274721-Alexandrium_andersonii.AAC.1